MTWEIPYEHSCLLPHASSRCRRPGPLPGGTLPVGPWRQLHVRTLASLRCSVISGIRRARSWVPKLPSGKPQTCSRLLRVPSFGIEETGGGKGLGSSSPMPSRPFPSPRSALPLRSRHTLPAQRSGRSDTSTCTHQPRYCLVICLLLGPQQAIWCVAGKHVLKTLSGRYALSRLTI